jgi:hypothetical protein
MKSARWRSAGIALALFSLNLWAVRRLLAVEYLDHMGSIEGAYISLARWITQNWGDLSWFPLWYGGIPFQNTYPPLLHMLVGAVSTLAGLTPARAYHLTAAVVFCLGPVTLYWLTMRISNSRLAGAAAGLFYTLMPVSTWLIPVVRRDAGGLWGPRRLQVLVQYGEGPHIAALALLPVAMLLIWKALIRQRPSLWLMASVAAAGVSLTNWLGAAALVMSTSANLFAIQTSLHDKIDCTSNRPVATTWLRAVVLALGAFALMAPWLPPSTIYSTALNERIVRSPLSAFHLRLTAAIGAILLVALLTRLLRRLSAPAHVSFAIFFLVPAAGVPLLAEWFGVYVIPQPQRYHLEMEMAVAILLGLAVAGTVRAVPRRAGEVTLCTMLLIAAYATVKYVRPAEAMIRPAAIQDTVEYKEAMWFDSHMRGRRVFAPGSVGFFLNAFTDTQQFAGGFDPGVVNTLWAHAQYQVLSGENAGQSEGEIARLWLNAYGVDAVGVAGEGSRESFKPFRNPRKFADLLAELWREGEDVIYGIPRRSPGLAHVIQRSSLPSRRPESGIDVEPLRRYVAGLEDPVAPRAILVWRNAHAASITLPGLKKDQVVSVQITFHRGWKAAVRGERVPVYADQLGQIVAAPVCREACTLELTYDGGAERVLTLIGCFGVLTAALAWIALERLRRSKSTA